MYGVDLRAGRVMHLTKIKVKIILLYVLIYFFLFIAVLHDKAEHGKKKDLCSFHGILRYQIQSVHLLLFCKRVNMNIILNLLSLASSLC